MYTDNTCAYINSSQFKNSTLNTWCMTHVGPGTPCCSPAQTAGPASTDTNKCTCARQTPYKASRKRAACLHTSPACHQHARCQQAPQAALERQQNVNTHARLSSGAPASSIASTHTTQAPQQRKRLNPPPPTQKTAHAHGKHNTSAQETCGMPAHQPGVPPARAVPAGITRCRHSIPACQRLMHSRQHANKAGGRQHANKAGGKKHAGLSSGPPASSRASTHNARRAGTTQQPRHYAPSTNMLLLR